MIIKICVEDIYNCDPDIFRNYARVVKNRVFFTKILRHSPPNFKNPVMKVLMGKSGFYIMSGRFLICPKTTQRIEVK